MFVFDAAMSLYDFCFSSSFWIFAFTIGNLVLLVGSSLFYAIGWVRRHAAEPNKKIEPLKNYPMITVVMCCKGVHADSYKNYCRNLSMDYPGPVEFIFVIESTNDPAWECAERAIKNAHFASSNHTARITNAGVSYHNAQKIHNMLHGVACSDPQSEYVLFADDDVFFYSGLIEELLTPLVDEPNKILVSTGYEFCVPDKNAGLGTYALFVYRIQNLLSFITPRPVLCWGGCWFAPLRLFKENFFNLVDCYLDGGYSDDTIISTLVQKYGYVCSHPYKATFPTQPDPNMAVKKYYDFIKRQMFVLVTYSSSYNKRVCHSLAFLIVATVWVMVIWIYLIPFASILAFLSLFSSQLHFTPQFFLGLIGGPLWVYLEYAVYNSTKIMLKNANSVRPAQEQITFHFNPINFYAGFVIHFTSMSVSLIQNFIKPSIVWAGVTYHVKNGKIFSVERKDKEGKKLTEQFAQSVSRAVKKEEFKTLLPGLKIAERMRK